MLESSRMETNLKEELEQKIQETAEKLRELAKSDPQHAEEFNKLQKSDPGLEDLRK